MRKCGCDFGTKVDFAPAVVLCSSQADDKYAHVKDICFASKFFWCGRKTAKNVADPQKIHVKMRKPCQNSVMSEQSDSSNPPRHLQKAVIY